MKRFCAFADEKVSSFGIVLREACVNKLLPNAIFFLSRKGMKGFCLFVFSQKKNAFFTRWVLSNMPISGLVDIVIKRRCTFSCWQGWLTVELKAFFDEFSIT
jgi:hypothetical protein